MRKAYKPRLHLRSLLIVLLLPAFARAQCYDTPQAAIDGARSSGSSPFKTETVGYRVLRMANDQLLGRSWAVVVHCDHPDWSTLAYPVSPVSSLEPPKPHPASASNPIAVHAGDPVRLWRREALLQIEVAGIAEQNGSLGETVRVRLSQRNNEDPFAPKEFAGVVKGPSDVEIKP